MKEALKLLGAMLAIIASVSAFHEVRTAPASTDVTFTCQRQLCNSDFDCLCGTCNTTYSECVPYGVHKL